MNANEDFRDYNCSDTFYSYSFGLIISEGVLALAKKYECFWLIDIIASYQKELKQEEFQVWKLTKNEDDSANVECSDGNDNILRRQKIQWTDFSATECSIWIENNTAILPSEH